MENKYIISVIVPVYNVEKYLRRCLNSILSQTVTSIEVILVDDGSTDSSGSICDEYASKDNRITVIHQRNYGVSVARNTGLSIAHGEYIGFCDPDDFIAPEMYEVMLSAFTPDIDLVICGYNYYNEEYQKDESRDYQIKENEIIDNEELWKRLSDMPPTIRHGVVNKLFRRELLSNLYFDNNLKSSEDLDFLLQYISKIQTSIVVNRPLYQNLVREGSATHGGLEVRSLHDSLLVHDRMYMETVNKFPALKHHALAFLLDVATLKYNESKNRPEEINKKSYILDNMRRFIRKRAILSINNPEIRFKTKIYYLLLWFRK